MITAEDIINAYKVSGIKPINRKTIHIDEKGKFCGCALTALYVARNGVLPDDNNVVMNWAAKNLGYGVGAGIVVGFDCPTTVLFCNLDNYEKQRNEASLAAKKLGLN